jgi:hypothetical protein
MIKFHIQLQENKIFILFHLKKKFLEAATINLSNFFIKSIKI